MLVSALVASILLEGLVYWLPFLWKARKYVVGLPVILTAFASGALLFVRPGPLTLLLAFVSVFRIFNQLRIAEGRINEAYLKASARRTGLVLGIFQLISLPLIYWAAIDWSGLAVWVAPAQLVLSIVVLMTLIRNLAKTEYTSAEQHYNDHELPTVTVAIPARNETEDLEQCLRSVLASNYPKLEILVLDDCSQDKTAEVIKSFAHDGVRFVKGYEPDEHWLAKNQAYDKLADEADGEMILFCGVDVRFGTGAIRALVTTAMSRQKEMVSVMPNRAEGGWLESFIQPMRYWWELAPPRRQFNRPPVLSTCWLIRRKTLQKLGGMEAVRQSIVPEAYFAREIIKSDGYSFVRSGKDLDVQTQKDLAEQRETAIRMRYPQLRRRPEWVMFLSLGEMLFLLGPFVVVLCGFWTGFGWIQVVAGVAAVCLILSHVLIVRVSNAKNQPIAVVNFPFAVATEIGLTYWSIYKYEFSTVEWKGRNICIPVMHVYPRLPQA